MKRRSNNEGTIFQRKSDDRWVVRLPVKGRPKPIEVYCKTEGEAVDRLHELITAFRTGTYVDPDNITLSQWLKRWMVVYVQDEVSDNWYKRKLDLIKKHIDPELGQLQLQKVLNSDIKLHYKKLMKTGKKKTIKEENGIERVVVSGLSSQTVKHIHNILKPAFCQAVEDGLIVEAKNPMKKIKAPKIVKTREARTLSEEEIGKYLAELQPHRLYAAFVLDLCSALRRGELIGLQWPDLNFETGVLSVLRQVLRIQNLDEPGSSLQYASLKTETSIGYIKLPLCAINELRAHKERQDKEKELAGQAYHDEGLIFCTALGKKLDTRRIYELHCRALKRANIEHTAFHNLRHTVATLLLKKGENIKTIQELLRHADISTTLNTYSHVLDEMKAASAERLDGIIGGVLPEVNPVPVIENVSNNPIN